MMMPPEDQVHVLEVCLFLVTAGWTWEHVLVMRHMARHRAFLESLAEAGWHRDRRLAPYTHDNPSPN